MYKYIYDFLSITDEKKKKSVSSISFSIYINLISFTFQFLMRVKKGSESNGRKKNSSHEHPLVVHCTQNSTHTRAKKNRYIITNCTFFSDR